MSDIEREAFEVEMGRIFDLDDEDLRKLPGHRAVDDEGVEVYEGWEDEAAALTFSIAWQVWQAARAQSGQGGESLARRFHEIYERLAPTFGYQTRDDTKQFDPKSANGRLMVAVCKEILSQPQPAQRGVPEWVKCSERLPTEKDADSEGQVWAYLGATGSEDVYLRRPGSVRELYYNDCATHWMPTGLKRPQPPREGKDDE